MAKAPMVVDAVLGAHCVTISANENATRATIYGESVTADQLRALADKLDRLEAAAKVFYGTQSVLADFAITYAVSESKEDSIIIVACTAEQALTIADTRHAIPRKYVRSVLNKTTNEVVY